MLLPYFIGPALYAKSRNINASRLVNLYLELTPGDSKAAMALLGTPGTILWGATSIPFASCREFHVFGGKLYAVIERYLVSFDSYGTVSAVLGTLATKVGRVIMKDNGIAAAGIGGDQMMITDGTNNGYIYNITTDTFSTISGGGWPTGNITGMDFIAGYFVVTVGMSHYASDLYDGLTWNALATSPVSATPDAIAAVANNHQQLWFIKGYSSEVWYLNDTPTSQGSPFSRLPGAVIDFGTDFPATVAKGDNSLFWVATQKNGDVASLVGVIELNGYTPQVISPPAITYQISKWPDASAYCYSEAGHTFYVLTSAGGNQTFVYDASLAQVEPELRWHERTTNTGGEFVIGRHLANCYAFFAGKHLIGDWQSGNVYAMSSDYLDDAGQPLVSIRQSQHIFERKSLKNSFIRRLDIDAEMGVGNPVTGMNPEVTLARSADGGHTFGNEYPAALGKSGNYRTLLSWRRLGYARDHVFRLTISDPCKRVLIAAYAE
jgi:hypothetical protein